jgi:hypothetical protein
MTGCDDPTVVVPISVTDDVENDDDTKVGSGDGEKEGGHIAIDSPKEMDDVYSRIRDQIAWARESTTIGGTAVSDEVFKTAITPMMDKILRLHGAIVEMRVLSDVLEWQTRRQQVVQQE